MVDASQLPSPIGERPPVDVAPRLEQPEHAIELAGQRVGAASDAAFETAYVLLQPLGPLGRPQVAAEVRAPRDRMRLQTSRECHGPVATPGRLFVDVLA